MDIYFTSGAVVGLAFGLLRLWARRALRMAEAPVINGESLQGSASAPSPLAIAWAKDAARRWCRLYLSGLDTSDNFQKIGGVKVFASAQNNYISYTLDDKTCSGKLSEAEKVLFTLFLSADFLPDFEARKKESSLAVMNDFPEDLPEEEIQDLSAWDHPYYQEQARRNYLQGVDLTEPHSLEDIVAGALTGRKNCLDRADFERETGLHKELDGFRTLWTRCGGLSLVALAEQIAADYNHTGFIPRSDSSEGWDIQAVRDAIIDLFTVCSRPSDFAKIVKNNNLQRLEDDLDFVF